MYLTITFQAGKEGVYAEKRERFSAFSLLTKQTDQPFHKSHPGFIQLREKCSGRVLIQPTCCMFTNSFICSI